MRTEQCDQACPMEEIAKLWCINVTKSLIIKLLTEILHTLSMNTMQDSPSIAPTNFVKPKKTQTRSSTRGLIQFCPTNKSVKNPFVISIYDPIIWPTSFFEKRRPPVDPNNHPENQTTFSRRRVRPGQWTYNETVKAVNSPNPITVTNRITKGIRRAE